MSARRPVITIESDLIGQTIRYEDEPITPPGYSKLAGRTFGVRAIWLDADSEPRLLLQADDDGTMHKVYVGTWLVVVR